MAKLLQVSLTSEPSLLCHTNYFLHALQEAISTHGLMSLFNYFCCCQLQMKQLTPPCHTIGSPPHQTPYLHWTSVNEMSDDPFKGKTPERLHDLAGGLCVDQPEPVALHSCSPHVCGHKDVQSNRIFSLRRHNIRSFASAMWTLTSP